jgi:hypothetical protein
MDKRIEIVNASDPATLKQQLEQLVNLGWQIKGVVSYNPNVPGSEPFVILQRDVSEDPAISDSFYVNENLVSEQIYTKPEPPKKEISISMG